jgi:hypothetical protein
LQVLLLEEAGHTVRKRSLEEATERLQGSVAVEDALRRDAMPEPSATKRPAERLAGSVRESFAIEARPPNLMGVRPSRIRS